ncbi:MAG: hypothetical protein C4524_00860 [Candidatus Zixiibacteriota bacterium]|nr:MAG: hypothetical protein C4524_00860 [candidate division Zixibacteria bacterium]
MKIKLWMLFALAAAVTPAAAQEVVVMPYQVYHAIVKDHTLIEEFRAGQFLAADLRIDSLEVIDATRNGFGQGDLMVIYPNKDVIHLMTVEEPLRSFMNSWRFNANQQFTSPNKPSTEILKDAKELESAYAGMLTFVLQGVELYYPTEENIEGFFRRDKETTFIELWNFNPDELKYREPININLSDTQQVYDLLQVVSRDTVFIVDSTLYDAIYIYKTIHDTVYVPVEKD